MKRAPTVLAVAVSLAIMAACGQRPPRAGSGRIGVVAAFYPLAFVASRVGGSDVSVQDLTPVGTEPHDLELTPSQLRSIREADLVLYVGSGFQPALERAIADAGDAEGLDVLRGQSLRNGDPHIWLDPDRLADVGDHAAEAMAKQRPRSREAFRRRAAALREELEALGSEMDAALAGCPRRDIVTTHAAFAYLASRFGLRQVALEGTSPEAEPTPRRLAEVRDFARRHGVTTVFTEPLVGSRPAETLAREIGGRTAVLNPLESLTKEQSRRGRDYVDVMQANLRALRRGLGCGRS